jgi:hypothetical protein
MKQNLKGLIKTFDKSANLAAVIGAITLLSYVVFPYSQLIAIGTSILFSAFGMFIGNALNKIDMIYEATCPNLVSVT